MTGCSPTNALNTPPEGWLGSDEAWRQRVGHSRSTSAIVSEVWRKKLKPPIPVAPALLFEARGPLRLLWDVTDVLRLVSVQVEEPDRGQRTRRQRFWFALARDHGRALPFTTLYCGAAAYLAAFGVDAAFGDPASVGVVFGVGTIAALAGAFGTRRAIRREVARLPEIRLTEHRPELAECTTLLMLVLSDCDTWLKDRYPYPEILTARDAAWYLIWALASLQGQAPAGAENPDVAAIAHSTLDLGGALAVWQAAYNAGREDPARKTRSHTQRIPHATGNGGSQRERQLQDRVDYAVTYADLAIAELTEAVSV